MRDDAEPAKAFHVLHDRIRLATQRIGRSRHVERHEVSTVRADFDGVHAEYAVKIGRRVRRARPVTVVRENDELQAGAFRRGSDRIFVRSAIRTIRMNVIGAGDRAPRCVGIGLGGEADRARRQSDEQKKNDGDHQGRRHECNLFHCSPNTDVRRRANEC